MSDLQWALVILGALFLLALLLWEWRRGRGRDERPPAVAEPPTLTGIDPGAGVSPRREPRIAEFDAPRAATEEPPRFEIDDGEDPAEALHVSLSDEEAVDIPGATTVVTQDAPAAAVEDGSRPIRWPPEQLPERVLGLRVVTRADPFPGRTLRLALLAAGLRHGPQQIFHRTDDDGNVLASVANLVRPGSLVPEQMDAQAFRGLSLFAVLPGPLPATHMLEGLVDLARRLAARLGGTVQDEHGTELDSARLAQLQQAVEGIGEAGAADDGQD